jgi:hypothetical protein
MSGIGWFGVSRINEPFDFHITEDSRWGCSRCANGTRWFEKLVAARLGDQDIAARLATDVSAKCSVAIHAHSKIPFAIANR